MPNELQVAPVQSSVAPVQIYGPDGRPATLKPAQLTEDLLGSYDSYLAASMALPPFNPDLLIASRGYAVLEEQTHLAAARAPLNIIRQATLYKNWEVQAAVSDQTDARCEKAAEMAGALRYALENIIDAAGNVQDFRHVVYELLGAVHFGFSVTEIHWKYLERGPYAGRLGFGGFSAKKCRQIGFGLDPGSMAVNSITSYTPLNGYRFDLPVEKVLRYTFQPDASLPYGNGIGRVVYKHTWSIDFITKFWNIALELFGTPFILGHAPPNAMKLAQAALAAIRQGAPAVLPAGVEAELVQVAAGGLASFKDALQYHGDQCALAYLNSTLTSGTSAGGTNTNALGKVHQDTTGYGLGFVRTDVEGVMNGQLVRRWVVLNYGEEFLEIAPRISLGQWDAVDMASLATSFDKLIGSKVLHEEEPVIRERLKLPPPSPDTQKKLDARRDERDGPEPSDEHTADPDDPKNAGDGKTDDEETDD